MDICPRWPSFAWPAHGRSLQNPGLPHRCHWSWAMGHMTKNMQTCGLDMICHSLDLGQELLLHLSIGWSLMFKNSAMNHLYNALFTALWVLWRWGWLLRLSPPPPPPFPTSLVSASLDLGQKLILHLSTVEPLYNEVLGTMKITLLYQVIISG